MEAGTAPGVVILHPNRDKPEAKATKSAVVLLLLVSAGLIAVITLGGLASLQGATPGAIAYILIYIAMAYYIHLWNRGLLPVAAAAALIFGIIAAIAAPSWFARDKAGFDDPALEPGILGLLTVILIPVQVLLMAFSMRGFQQEWNVEVEVARDEYEGRVPGDPPPYEDEPVDDPDAERYADDPRAADLDEPREDISPADELYDPPPQAPDEPPPGPPPAR